MDTIALAERASHLEAMADSLNELLAVQEKVVAEQSERLKESEALLKSILMGSPTLQFVIDKDHRVISWNKALEEYSGIKETTILGTRNQWMPFYDAERPVLADLLVDGMIEHLPEWYQGKFSHSRLVEGAYESTDFFPRMGHSGTWLYFTAAPIRNANGAVIGAVETLVDISQRKLAEDALWESREHYRAIIDNSQLAIAVLDVNHKILMVNPRFSELFKKPADYFVGKSCFNEFERRTAVCTHCPGVRAMISRKPEEMETEGVRDDGSRFFTRNQAVPFFGPDGALKGFVEMVEDITERKRVEKALKESNDRFLAFIKEAAMRLKNPMEVVEQNISLVVDDIERGQFENNDVLLQLKIQIRNLEQIRQNIIELNKMIVNHSGDLSEASRKFLTE